MRPCLTFKCWFIVNNSVWSAIHSVRGPVAIELGALSLNIVNIDAKIEELYCTATIHLVMTDAPSEPGSQLVAASHTLLTQATNSLLNPRLLHLHHPLLLNLNFFTSSPSALEARKLTHFRWILLKNQFYQHENNNKCSNALTDFTTKNIMSQNIKWRLFIALLLHDTKRT